MFSVHADVSDRVLDVLALLFVLLIVGVPLCVPILMKKRMEKRAAVLEKEFPNINYKFTSHNCVLYLDTEGGHRRGVENNPSRSANGRSGPDHRHPHQQRPAAAGTSLVSCQFRLDGKR